MVKGSFWIIQTRVYKEWSMPRLGHDLRHIFRPLHRNLQGRESFPDLSLDTRIYGLSLYCRLWVISTHLWKFGPSASPLARLRTFHTHWFLDMHQWSPLSKKLYMKAKTSKHCRIQPTSKQFKLWDSMLRLRPLRFGSRFYIGLGGATGGYALHNQ